MKRKILIYLLILCFLVGNGMYFNFSVSEAADPAFDTICIDEVYTFAFRTDFYLTCSIKSKDNSIVEASVQHGALDSNQVMISLTGISEGTAKVELYVASLTLKVFTVNVVKHSNLIFVKEKKATCTGNGYREHYVCEQCGTAYSDEEGNDILAEDAYWIPATGHTIEHLEYMLPTFDSAGHISYYHCSVCDAGFSDSEGKVALSPHIYTLPQLDSDSILATGISLNPSRLKLYVGESADVIATITPDTSSFPLKKTSSDKNIAIVNDTGEIYAVSSGTCDIVFETINGVSAVCKVIVEKKPEVSDTLKIISVSMKHSQASLNLSTSDNNLFNQTVTIYAKDENRQIIGTCTTSFTKSTSSAYMYFDRMVEPGEKIEFYAQKPNHTVSPSVIEKKSVCGTKTVGEYSVGPMGATGHSKNLEGEGGIVTVNVSGKKYTSGVDEQGFWYVSFDTPVMDGLEVSIQENCLGGCEFQERIEKCVVSDRRNEHLYYISVYKNYIRLDNRYFTSDKLAYLYYDGKEYLLPETPSKTIDGANLYYLPELLQVDSYVSIIIKNKYTGTILMNSRRKVELPALSMSDPSYFELGNWISFTVLEDLNLKSTIYYTINEKTYKQTITESGTTHSVTIQLSEKYPEGTIVYVWLEDETGYTTTKLACNISYSGLWDSNGNNNSNNSNNNNGSNSEDNEDYDDEDDDWDDDWDDDKPKPKSYAVSLKVPKKFTIAVDTKRKISVRRAKSNTKMPKLKWKSSNKRIATVNSLGQVSARKIGKCKISCVIQNGKGKGKKYTCKVQVRENTWTGGTISSYNVYSYRYGQVYLDVAKVYYSGNNLVVKCVALNNRMFRAVKFARLQLKITTMDHDLIAKRTFWNYPLNLGKYSKKYITFTFPKKYQKAKKDLRYYGVDIDYDYTYVYNIE